jgi:hypothetical protein
MMVIAFVILSFAHCHTYSPFAHHLSSHDDVKIIASNPFFDNGHARAILVDAEPKVVASTMQALPSSDTKEVHRSILLIPHSSSYSYIYIYISTITCRQ